MSLPYQRGSSKESPANVGDIRDMGSIPGSGRSPGGGHGNPLQYSYLENSLDSGAWWATAHRVEKSQIQLKRLSMHAHMLNYKMRPTAEYGDYS